MEMLAKMDANQEKLKAHMKAFNEMRDRRETERKAYDRKMMAKWEADQDTRKAQWKANRGQVMERLETIHNKTDVNQMRLEPEMEHQENMDAWIVDMKDGRKERLVCQEAREAN